MEEELANVLRERVDVVAQIIRTGQELLRVLAGFESCSTTRNKERGSIEGS